MSLILGAELRGLPARETPSIAALHLSAGISLPLSGYCCKCVSHLAAVCRHRAHLSPGPLSGSPLKGSGHYSAEMGWTGRLCGRNHRETTLPCVTSVGRRSCSWNNMVWGGYWSGQTILGREEEIWPLIRINLACCFFCVHSICRAEVGRCVCVCDILF